MEFTNAFFSRKHLDAMCQNPNLTSKIRKNIENLEHFAFEKCLYNSMFALPIDHAKIIKTSIFVNFHKKIDFEGSQTPLKQGI